MAPKRKRSSNNIMADIGHDRKILVSVDFGTTFSGAAWAQSRNPETQTIFIQWPDSDSENPEGVSSDKVPTEIKYDGSNYKWGFQIPDGVPRYQWFKLELDPSHDRSTELASKYPDPLAAPPGYASSAEKLSTDYLTSFRLHIERSLRYKLPESALASTKIEYIITVPAVWTDAAQAKTRRCAERAGMGKGADLHIISEPEAAAIFALKQIDTDDIAIGDTFVLVDAGGGTVDLIAYTVIEKEPVLKIEEASPGTGALCGGSFLNRRFQHFLQKKLEKAPDWDEELLEEAMIRFENRIKRKFRGTFEEEFVVPVAGMATNPELGIRMGKMRLPGAEVRKIFEPVLKEVLGLVIDQIKASKKPVKAVLLVGGFGQSPYLRDEIQHEVKSYNVKVLQSPQAQVWTAVVRGALMKGLASTSPDYATVRISGRAARKHYGIKICIPFKLLEHDINRRIWSSFYGGFSIHIMKWFIQKGEKVEEDKPQRLGYLQNIKVRESAPLPTITLEAFVASDPANTGAPLYPLETQVRRLVEVTADLSRIPANKVRQVEGADGDMYWKIPFQVEITYYSAYTAYELIHDGINYGAVTAEYV